VVLLLGSWYYRYRCGSYRISEANNDDDDDYDDDDDDDDDNTAAFDLQTHRWSPRNVYFGINVVHDSPDCKSPCPN